MTIFREHSEMILKEENIACFQVNWENKPDNIKNIAEALNISLDSMVFVDDSLLEIEAVKAMLPEVTTIRYERDMSYEQFSCFNLKNNISVADIKKRNETYRTNKSREELKSEYNSYDEYIAALDIKIDIHEALPVEYSRIAELTQRTNKCTNGKRYTVAKIKERASRDDIKLYSLFVSDRFSDLGLVGAIEVEEDVLTLFSLSCRALGREIESKLLVFIAEKYQINKIIFNSTEKNEYMKTLFVNDFPKTIISNSEGV
jgi:FkbH-like protein